MGLGDTTHHIVGNTESMSVKASELALTHVHRFGNCLASNSPTRPKASHKADYNGRSKVHVKNECIEVNVLMNVRPSEVVEEW